jgi:hypothetical protein
MDLPDSLEQGQSAPPKHQIEKVFLTHDMPILPGQDFSGSFPPIGMA